MPETPFDQTLERILAYPEGPDGAQDDGFVVDVMAGVRRERGRRRAILAAFGGVGALWLTGHTLNIYSMIGLVLLMGLVAKNSILLVDFIHHEVANGVQLSDAVVKAGAVRTRPIALTAVAAMAGAFFILDDPIFSGLAVSLIFGILVSTLLTLVVIPVVYYAYEYRKHGD